MSFVSFARTDSHQNVPPSTIPTMNAAVRSVSRHRISIPPLLDAGALLASSPLPLPLLGLDGGGTVRDPLSEGFDQFGLVHRAPTGEPHIGRKRPQFFEIHHSLRSVVSHDDTESVPHFIKCVNQVRVITQDKLDISARRGQNKSLLQQATSFGLPKSANKPPVTISVAGVLSFWLFGGGLRSA